MREQIITGVSVSKDAITRLDEVFLEPSMVMLNGPVVHGYKKPLIQIDEPTKMVFLADDFKKDPNIRDLNTMIARSVPGVYQAGPGQPLYFRGSRSGSVQYIVDGMKGLQGTIKVPSGAIGEMSIYTGGLPAKYGDVLGGVIVIETKSYFSELKRRRK